MSNVNLENLFEVALENFPYELEATSITLGDYEGDNGFVEYAEEHTFTAGKMLDEEIIAGGWIELRQDSPDEEPYISAFFGLSRSGDWEAGRILPETVAVQGNYDLATKTWELWIDQY